MRKNGRFWTSLLATSVYLGSSSMWLGCGHDEALAELPDQGQERQRSTVPVSSELAQATPVVRPVVATGSTQPVRAANISPEITATITDILVEEGAQVEAGQTLMRLNSRTARLQAAQAKAGAAAAQAQAEQLASDYERMAKLQSQGVVAQTKVQQLRAHRDATRGQQDAARAAASLARSMVGNAQVRAPFAGTVSALMMEVGELATMMPPRVLLRLIDLSEVEVRVPVPERELARISLGDPVEAHFPSLETRLNGQVTHVGFEIHPIARTAEVVTTINNEDRRLRGGMFTELEIRPSSERQAIQLPAKSVGGSGEQRFVYVVEDCLAKRIDVDIAPIGGGRVTVEEGLSEGQRVVTQGIARLADGVRVSDSDAGCSEPDAEADQ